MRNPFKRKPAAPNSIEGAAPVLTPVSSPKTKSRPQLFTDQTIDYLRNTEPDDVLELMLPRLVIEQQTRLTSTAKELEEIDQKLAKLYASRDDVYSVMAQSQNNGVADF